MERGLTLVTPSLALFLPRAWHLISVRDPSPGHQWRNGNMVSPNQAGYQDRLDFIHGEILTKHLGLRAM